MRENKDNIHTTLKNRSVVDDCIEMTVMSIKGETKCREMKDDSELEGPLGEDHASSIPTIGGNKRLK
jgi:hypothetical protein